MNSAAIEKPLSSQSHEDRVRDQRAVGSQRRADPAGATTLHGQRLRQQEDRQQQQDHPEPGQRHEHDPPGPEQQELRSDDRRDAGGDADHQHQPRQHFPDLHAVITVAHDGHGQHHAGRGGQTFHETQGGQHLDGLDEHDAE
ncbi:MAG TPA: hypothetical protein VIJ00_14565 [Nakamurella sp.]